MNYPSSPTNCPMDALLRLLMGPWTTYILWVLQEQGALRFGALKRKVPGVSAKMLTERLRLLQDAGVVYRRYEPTIPPEVTYGLTRRGEELNPVLEGLNALARKWKAENEQAEQAAAEATRPRPEAKAARAR